MSQMIYKNRASAPTTSNAIVFDTYSDFARYLQHRKCPSCSTGFIKRSDDVDAIFKVWLSGGLYPSIFTHTVAYGSQRRSIRKSNAVNA